MDDEILKLDLYEIIGASISSNESEIKKAYRKKALSCHPDKNPDNPKAAELFLQLSKALEILLDSTARAAYDKVINARAQAKVRARELDAKRKKFKDDLEAREEAFKRQSSTSLSDEAKLKAEIERLRKEGSRQVEEEKERLKQKIIEELKQEAANHAGNQGASQVNIRWKVDPDDETNGGYNHDNLKIFLSKWGEVTELILLPHKKGKALVEFSNRKAAESAVSYERGLISNPLQLKGVWEKKKTSQPSFMNMNVSSKNTNLFPSATKSGGVKRKDVPVGVSCSSIPDIFNIQPQTFDTEEKESSNSTYESMVLNNLKRAQERQRLIEQMKAEDENT